MIVRSAATVAGLPAGELCIRTTGWAWVPPAWARLMIRLTQNESPDPLAFQSSVSTDQFQTLMLRAWARLSVVLLYEPYGGRKKHGGLPTKLICSAVVRSISVAWSAADSVVMSGWPHEWLPSTNPWAASCCTSAGRTVWLTPMLKNVAATPSSWRIGRISAVLVPGPSSKVRATVLPIPGAELFTPDPTAGQEAAAWGVTCGAPVIAGSAASTSDGGQGPASSDGHEGGGGVGAAPAAGVVSEKAPTRRTAMRRRPMRRCAVAMLNHAPGRCGAASSALDSAHRTCPSRDRAVRMCSAGPTRPAPTLFAHMCEKLWTEDSGGEGQRKGQHADGTGTAEFAAGHRHRPPGVGEVVHEQHRRRAGLRQAVPQLGAHDDAVPHRGESEGAVATRLTGRPAVLESHLSQVGQSSEAGEPLGQPGHQLRPAAGRHGDDGAGALLPVPGGQHPGARLQQLVVGRHVGDRPLHRH